MENYGEPTLYPDEYQHHQKLSNYYVDPFEVSLNISKINYSLVFSGYIYTNYISQRIWKIYAHMRKKFSIWWVDAAGKCLTHTLKHTWEEAEFQLHPRYCQSED